MTITRQQLTQFSRIYNTLLQVNTHGEDTMVMGDCLRALQRLILEIDEMNNNSMEAPIEENIVEG